MLPSTPLQNLARTVENLAKRIRALEVKETSGNLSSTSAFMLGNPSTDGSWRIIRDGNNLNFERLETGTWVSKYVLTP